ncbi:MAG: polyketide cyclase [Myxococcales bacterium]|jgi:uncharacterized protein YndB with AHSA1/START domain|nr:polyketide cyclase [Myxococcales bacterium]
MSQPSVHHDSFTIERTFAATPERVFAAFADPVKKRRWFVEGEGWTVDSYEADFREGGFERSRFRFNDGPEMTNETYYHDIIPGRRIINSYSMTWGGKRISVSLATVDIEPDGAGSRVRFTEQAVFFEGSDGVEGRRQGWTELIGKLEEELTTHP